jgi:hypothetical protein
MRSRAVVALAVLTVSAAGCNSGSGSSSGNGAGGGAAVAWTATKPSQVTDRSPVSTPCRAADLHVVGQVKFVPRLQGGIALVGVRNTGSRTCRLTGRPIVTLITKGGPVQVDRAIPTTPSNFPETTYPASSLLALRPGDTGALTISWDNWCDPVVTDVPHVPPSAVRIALPHHRGSISADYNAVPSCVDPNAPSTIGVSVFQPSLVRAGRPWTTAFLSATIPDQPVHAKRGGILHYRVVLKNDSKVTAGFTRCPAYIQQLAPRGKVEVYQLNCAAAHAIAPGRSLAFAMQVRVPKSSPPGANGLFWGLDPFGARAPQVHARVTIDK